MNNPIYFYHYNINTNNLKRLSLKHNLRNIPHSIIIAMATDNSRDAYKSEDDVSQVFLTIPFLKKENFYVETYFYQVKDYSRNIHIMFFLSEELSLFYHLNNDTYNFQEIINKCLETFDLYFHKGTANLRRATICSYLLNR